MVADTYVFLKIIQYSWCKQKSRGSGKTNRKSAEWKCRLQQECYQFRHSLPDHLTDVQWTTTLMSNRTRSITTLESHELLCGISLYSTPL